MKIKKGFAKRNIAGSQIVVPVGSAAYDFNGMITLNDSGAFFWDCLCEDITEAELVGKVLEEYETDRQTAENDVKKFIKMLKENDLLDE